MATATDLEIFMPLTDPFVRLCARTFGWGDLSQDTVMDVGCGRDLHCSKSILRNFPNVKSIIALDGNKDELEAINFKLDRIKLFYANVRMRPDISEYEGEIDKVISTRVLHQIPDKEEVFKNVYRLLKPGGEAAFLFTSDLFMCNVLEALSEDPKYKKYYKGSFLMRLYSRKLKKDDYIKILDKAKFKVVNILEEKESFPVEHFAMHEATLHREVDETFAAPSELLPEIKKAASELYRKKYRRKMTFYTKTEMTIFVTKPSDSGSGSSSD